MQPNTVVTFFTTTTFGPAFTFLSIFSIFSWFSLFTGVPGWSLQTVFSLFAVLTWGTVSSCLPFWCCQHRPIGRIFGRNAGGFKCVLCHVHFGVVEYIITPDVVCAKRKFFQMQTNTVVTFVTFKAWQPTCAIGSIFTLSTVFAVHSILTWFTDRTGLTWQSGSSGPSVFAR